MSTSVVDPVVSAALSIVVKATVLMGIAVVVQLVVRRRASAATRHLLWMLAIVSVLLLPAASLVLPGWAVEVRSAPEPATRAPVATREAPGVDLSPPSPAAVIVEYPRAAPAAARASWSATIAGRVRGRSDRLPDAPDRATVAGSSDLPATRASCGMLNGCVSSPSVPIASAFGVPFAFFEVASTTFRRHWGPGAPPS